MKATMSRDGQYRVDMRITFRVGVRDLAEALNHAYRRHEGPMPKLPTAKIREAIRESFERRGIDTMDGWADHLTMADTQERHEWAMAQLRKAFPELFEAAEKTEVTPAATLGSPLPAICVHRRSDERGELADRITVPSRCGSDAGFGLWDDCAGGFIYHGDCMHEVASEGADIITNPEHDSHDPDGEYKVVAICRSHEEQPADTCEECFSEQADEKDCRCKECGGDGCHWCYWTGQRSDKGWASRNA